MIAETERDKKRLLEGLEGDKFTDFNAFFWGIESDVERSIMKFIATNCKGIATTAQLLNDIVYYKNICTAGRLYRILDSLVSHNYLYKVEQSFSYGGYSTKTIYYILRRDE